jgi:hypothetical protein
MNDTVTITDDSTHHITTGVADGMMMVFVRQFTLFDPELTSKKDTLTINLAGAYVRRLAEVQVVLGEGENHFTFDPGQAGIADHSDVGLNVRSPTVPHLCGSKSVPPPGDKWARVAVDKGRSDRPANRRYRSPWPAGGLVGVLGRVRVLLPQPRGTRPTVGRRVAFAYRDSIEGVPPMPVESS